MAEFNISGRMSVVRLKKEFKEIYRLELRVYNGNNFADDDATLASISDKKVNDFECRGNMNIGTFEERFMKECGLKVQVATLPDAKIEPGQLVNNKFTLNEAKEKFGI